MSYKPNIVVVGLGYVGLPLAIELSQHFNVVGLDNNADRVLSLKDDIDTNNEYSTEELERSNAAYTTNPEVLQKAEFIIVTVPTPITADNRPDVEPLRNASKLIGQQLFKNKQAISAQVGAGDGNVPPPIVVFESTVYPGLTEEFCVPIIEEHSQGMTCGKGFAVGYSPERVNPGDKVHTITTITKIVAGMDEVTLSKVDYVYSSITETHRASSIKVAEAAKVIENSQRDLNIAFVNELALIFDRLGIDTLDVLEAAGTKWNFLNFKPGLVGGHCISVDPYYLTWKAETAGIMSQVIAAGRQVNDQMPHHVVELISRGLNKRKKAVNGSKILILGATFKENCKDVRNSKVEDIILELEELGATVHVHDPFYTDEEIPFHKVRRGVKYTTDMNGDPNVDAIVLAVAHDHYKHFDVDRFSVLMSQPVIIDLKGMFPKHPDVIRL